jgi:hypothetical protein
MYLLSRSAQLTGAKGMDWARSMRDTVAGSLGQCQLYTRALSPAFGTVAWTTWWEDLGSMEAAFAQLAGDAKYASGASEGAAHIVGTVDDALIQAITEVPRDAEPSRYVGAIHASLAQGNYVRGFGAGVEIAQRVGAVTGVPTLFGRALTGPYGGVAWFSAFESLAHFESAEDALAADGGFAEYLDSTQGCFVEGSGQSVLWMRVD